MKILLQSTLFFPSVGGIETVSKCLAENYTLLGHSCTVLTRTVSNEKQDFSYVIARNPTVKEKIQLIKSHDIIHCNGASLELVLLSKILKKPIVWTHAGYQMVSIDGLGWYEGTASPLNRLESFAFHLRKQGLLKASIEFCKLIVRNIAAFFITKHVAITEWVKKTQNLANQVVIYNPFPINTFAKINNLSQDYEYDFFYLGRLVSEKGVETLVKAFHLFQQNNPGYTKKLLIIGSGNWQGRLEALGEEKGILHNLDFVGKQTGHSLLNWVSKGKIAIIPSEWEEPMGGVAIEMLAAGKLVIVSANGGLAECVGEAGLTFPNGDYKELCDKMQVLLHNKELQDRLLKLSPEQLTKFNELDKVKEYITLFEKIINGQ